MLSRVYRTFVLWNYDIYVIIIPCLTFVATLSAFQRLIGGEYVIIISLASAISFVKLQHHTNVRTSIFTKAVTEWTVAFLLSSFATTVYSTGDSKILAIWMKANKTYIQV